MAKKLTLVDESERRDRVEQKRLSNHNDAEQVRLSNRDCHVLDLGGGTIDVVLKDPALGGYCPRVLMIGGRSWEHVGEDTLGRWVYR